MKRKTYFGTQTKQAVENFSLPYHLVHLDLIYSIVVIKLAAAKTHRSLGLLNKKTADAIVVACNQILEKKHDTQFVTIALQGGAGTSINMNVNEVVAGIAQEFIGKNTIHPNDHVNMSQSTNDVNPSALKITCIQLTKKLLIATDTLIKSFEKKSNQFKRAKKLARTHIQDALPTTLGDELAAYEALIKRDKKRIEDALKYMYDLNLGGTAIGNGINAPPIYRKIVYKEFSMLSKLHLKPAQNLMSQTSSQTDFCHLSASITTLCLDMCKISADLRFLASGPKGGIGEISLQSLQPGSSIMPGKVNPIIPETISQVYHYIYGKNATIHEAARDSHLELAIMFPILADSIISILKMVTAALMLFSEKCVDLLQANVQRCLELLENSTAYATLLTPKFGYDAVSKLVKESLEKNISMKHILLEKKMITEKEFDDLLLMY